MIRLTLALPLLLLGCEQPNETVASYGAGGITWQLAELNGATFAATATLTLDEDGTVNGTAPCNSFTARQTVPYPWFKLEQIASTRMACPELAQETQFFEALRAMTLSEVSGTLLLLSNDTGAQMVFKPQSAPD